MRVYAGEYECLESDISFQDENLESPEVYYFKNQINDLDGALQKSQSAFHQSQSQLITANSTLSEQQSTINNLKERNQNLQSRLSAVTEEADEHAKCNQVLQTRLTNMEKENQKANGEQILGRKKLSDLGRTQVTATKTAYREEFRKSIDTFGNN